MSKSQAKRIAVQKAGKVIEDIKAHVLWSYEYKYGDDRDIHYVVIGTYADAAAKCKELEELYNRVLFINPVDFTIAIKP